MKNLLILWSLPNTQEEYDKYESIIDALSEYCSNISSPIDTKELL